MKKIIQHLKNNLLNSTFSKLFSVFVLFLLSGAAFADSSLVSGTPAWVTSTDPVANHTDLSIAYLAQVFGTVGSSLQGTTGQMLGMLISKFNVGVLVVSAIWLIFTIATICIRAATSGSFMGQNKNVFWVLLRIALAFALLLPGPATGYNLIQDMVMKVVVEGVSLADQTWSFGLGYISEGGSLWRRPETTSNNGQAIVSSSQATNIMGSGDTKNYTPPGLNNDTGLQIFINEVCMVSSSIANALAVNSNTGSGVANSATQAVQYSIIDDDADYRFAFPGYGNTGSNYAEEIINNSAYPSCGAVYWGNPPIPQTNSTSSLGVTGANCSAPVNDTDLAGTSSANHCAMAKAAVTQMVYGLLPAAKNYACSQSNAQGLSMCSGTPDSTSMNTTNVNTLFNSLINYVNGVTPIAQSQQLPASQSGNSAQASLSFMSDAQQAGWMMAGRYYWDLASIQAKMSNVGDVSTYVPSVAVMSGYPSSGCDSSSLIPTQVCHAVSGAPSAWNTYMNGSSSSSTSVQSLLNNYQKASNAGDTGPSPTLNGLSISINWAASLILKPMLTDVIRLCEMFNNGTLYNNVAMGTDPILFLHNVGMQCIAIAGDIWINVALALFAVAVATMFCDATADTWNPVSAVADWLKPILMIIAVGFLAVGVLFGYYVPLYPFAIFLFGVISWIIGVIEAMVAAPLVAFGLTHPEGHDFLGGAKQGLMLLLGVFLRPVLMVIGLIAGMILSYVSLRIVLFAYSGFLSDVFYVISPYSSKSNGFTAASSGHPYMAVSPNSLWAGAGATTANLAITELANKSIGGLVMLLFCFPLLLAIFASLVYVVTTQCFSLIYVLPDYVMRWIGAPTSQSQSAQMAQQLQGHISGTGKAIGNVLEKGYEGLDKKGKEEAAQGGGNEDSTSVSTGS